MKDNHELSEPAKNAIGILILCGIAAAFFYPMLFDGKVIFYRDFHFITYPTRYFLAQSYQEGVIPYWTSHSYGGMPFMATLHPGVFYPPSIFFFLKDVTQAMNLYYVFHFLVAGVFTFLLCRQWKLSWWAAMASGVTGMLSGYMLASALCSNLFLSSVWLPVIFWLYYRWAENRNSGYFIGLVIAIATQTLAACPEISVMTMLLLYAHAIIFMPRERGKIGYVHITVALGLAVVFALGLLAFQLAPTLKLLKHTFRGGGLDYGYHILWSMAPSKLVTLAFTTSYNDYLTTPKPGGDVFFSGLLHTTYMGIFAYLFLGLGLLLRRNKKVVFWLFIFFWGVFFALGGNNPLYEYFYQGMPFLDLFRYPEKYYFVSSFAAVFLVGYALDELTHATRHRQIKLPAVLVVLVLMLASIGIMAATNSQLELQHPLIIILIFGGLYTLFYYGKLPHRGFVASFLILLCLDVFIKGMGMLPLIDRSFYEQKPLLMDQLAGSAGKFRTYAGQVEQRPNPSVYPNGPTRLAGVRAAKQQLYPLQGMVFDIEHANGIPGLAMDIKNHLVWYQYLIHSEPEIRWRILKRTNVKYWIDGDSQMSFSPDRYPITLPDRIEVLEDALPRAFLVPNMRVLDKSKILETYYSADFNPLQEVILREDVGFQPSQKFEGQVREVTYRTNHVTVKTTQEGNGFLVLLDTDLPGWTVEVDGEERPILNANGLYRTVQLGPGEHTLEFDYFPEGFAEGILISEITLGIGVMGWVGWLALGFVRDRRKGELG